MTQLTNNPFDHVDSPLPTIMNGPFNRVPVFSTMGRGPRGKQGERGFPGEESRKDFETVAKMVAETSLKSGDICRTLGFHAAGDGGAAWYQVTDDATANDMDIIALENGLYAVLVIDKVINPLVLGITDDNFGEVVNYAISLTNSIYISPGDYQLTDEPIVLKNKTSVLIDENAVIEFTTPYCFTSDTLVSRASVSGGCIKNADGDRQNIGIYLNQARNCLIENIYIYNTNKAIVIDGKSSWAATNTIFNIHALFFNVGIHLTSNSGKQCNNTVIVSSYLIDKSSGSTATALKLDASGDTNKCFGLAVEDCSIGFNILATPASTPIALFGCRAENCDTILSNASGATNIIVVGCNFDPTFAANWNQNRQINDLNNKFLKTNEKLCYYDSAYNLRHLLSISQDGSTVKLLPAGPSKKVIIGGTDSNQSQIEVVQIDGIEEFKLLTRKIRIKSSQSNKFFDISVNDSGVISAVEVR